MRVLMLGWEFPPFITGGLGTACYGLTRALDEQGVEILFVLPGRSDPSTVSHLRLISQEVQTTHGMIQLYESNVLSYCDYCTAAVSHASVTLLDNIDPLFYNIDRIQQRFLNDIGVDDVMAL